MEKTNVFKMELTESTNLIRALGISEERESELDAIIDEAIETDETQTKTQVMQYVVERCENINEVVNCIRLLTLREKAHHLFSGMQAR